MNGPLALILMGAPGAGKSTQAQLLQARYGLTVLSTGAIVRQEIRKGTTLGRLVAPIAEEGLLIPDDLMIAVVRGALLDLPAGAPFLLDGFPRTTLQAAALGDLLRELGRPLSAVIALEITAEQAVERLAGRRMCEGVGAPFPLHIGDQAQVAACLAAGGRLVQRPDDSPEVVLERLDVYQTTTAPLLAYYKQQGLLQVVDAGRAPDEVQAAIVQALPDQAGRA